jgi:hypothetical protein
MADDPAPSPAVPAPAVRGADVPGIEAQQARLHLQALRESRTQHLRATLLSLESHADLITMTYADLLARLEEAIQRERAALSQEDAPHGV